MPLFHVSGSGWGVLGQYYGAETILLRDVDMAEIIRVIGAHQVTQVHIADAVNVQVISLEEAPQGYADFDSGAAKKFVLDPHGLIAN